MPEHILPLPPKWERDLDCGWVVFKSGRDDIRGYLRQAEGRSRAARDRDAARKPRRHRASSGRDASPGQGRLCRDYGGSLQPHRRAVAARLQDAEERRIKASLANPDEQSVPRRQAACRYLESMDGGRCAIASAASATVRAAARSIAGSAATRLTSRPRSCFYGAVVTGSLIARRRQTARSRGQGHMLQCPIQIHHGDADRAVTAPSRDAWSRR